MTQALPRCLRALPLLIFGLSAFNLSPALAVDGAWSGLLSPSTGKLLEGLRLGRLSQSGCGNVFSSPQNLTPINLSSKANAADFKSVVTWIKAPRNTGTVSLPTAISPEALANPGATPPEPQYIAVLIQRKNGSTAGRYYSSKTGSKATMPTLVASPGFIGPDTWISFESEISVPYIHEIGGIMVTFLKPGMWNDTSNTSTTPRNPTVLRPVCSDGTEDGGAEVSRSYLAAVVEFAGGKTKDKFGNAFNSSALAGEEADTSNVGVFASSHGGMLLYRALATSGLPSAKYVISWESPLQDVSLTSELGWKEDGDETRAANEGNNPYAYNEDSRLGGMILSGSTGPLTGGSSVFVVPAEPPSGVRAYDGTKDFRTNGITPDSYYLQLPKSGSAWPSVCKNATSVIGTADCHLTDSSGSLFNYPNVGLSSVHLTHRICESLGCADCRPSTFSCSRTKADGTVKELWPSHIGNPKQVNEWKRRAMLGVTFEDDGQYHEFNYFPDIGKVRDTTSNPLRVMLLFAKVDHGNGAGLDKPKIETAYRNLRALNAWVKLNPSKAYLDWVFSGNSGSKLCSTYDSKGNVTKTSLSTYCSPYFPDVPPNQQPRWTADTSVSTSLDQATIRHSDAAAKSYVGANDKGYIAYNNMFTKQYKLGAFAEMMDRTHSNEWGSSNLTSVLQSVAAP